MQENQKEEHGHGLVLIEPVIVHALRIMRAVECCFGHCIIVGLAGSGRKAIASFACFLSFGR